MSLLRTCMLTLLLPVLAAAPHGCSSEPRTAQSPTRLSLTAPPDFSLELIVRSASSGTPSAPHLAPAHYLLSPDGSLHYSSRSAPSSALPPIVRTLSRSQIDDLWSILADTGFADSSAAAPPSNHDLISPLADETIHLVSLTGNARSWEFQQSTLPARPTDPHTQKLVNVLASLAWVDLAADDAVILPSRYDYGPDPYVRYRKSSILLPAASAPAPAPSTPSTRPAARPAPHSQPQKP